MRLRNSERSSTTALICCVSPCFAVFRRVSPCFAVFRCLSSATERKRCIHFLYNFSSDTICHTVFNPHQGVDTLHGTPMLHTGAVPFVAFRRNRKPFRLCLDSRPNTRFAFPLGLVWPDRDCGRPRVSSHCELHRLTYTPATHYTTSTQSKHVPC